MRHPGSARAQCNPAIFKLNNYLKPYSQQILKRSLQQYYISLYYYFFQFWSLNQDNELKVDRLLCLEVTRHQLLKVMKCHGQGGTQEWRHNKVT